MTSILTTILTTIGFFILILLLIVRIIDPKIQTEKEIIAHGCAYYDPQTANFKWKDAK